MSHERWRDLQLSLFPEEEGEEESNAIRELFRQTGRLRTGRQYVELVRFLARFRRYSAFNNLLVCIQDPAVTFFATARHWERVFHRKLREEARPLVILVPGAPVAFVYDVRETLGETLPGLGEHPFNSRGELTEAAFSRLEENCLRHRLEVRREPLAGRGPGQLTRAGGRILSSEAPGRSQRAKFTLELPADQERAVALATLTHELAHIFLGHHGRDDEDDWWSERTELPERLGELEAETVSHLVCSRRGLPTSGPEYLAGYLADDRDLGRVDLAALVRVTDLLERMLERRVEPSRRPG